jgi:diaminohydroxyphosphoribosylaminopyrimidine deaminase/5-amino-6-(5-phosphoribosylamino)uracil reductase
VASHERDPYVARVSLSPDRLAAAAQRALDLAWAKAGATAPNPPVGCVLLDAHGEILAAAAHERAGSAHAEAAAIALCRAAGTLDLARAAVVTLEPCSHTGRTPPCASALLGTGIDLILVGAPDPHPRAPGRGFEILLGAGRRVLSFRDLAHPEAPRLARSAGRLIEPFASAVRRGRPLVTLKTALTAKGSMIPPPGRKTFTSETFLTHAHALRRRADAILTGSGCVLADNPAFTVRRVPDHPGKRRFLAILDRRRRVPEAYFAAARARGLEPRRYESLEAALENLGAEGALEVLVEAGPTLRGAVLESGLWDEEVIFQQAPSSGAADEMRIIRRDGAAAFVDFAHPAPELA